LLCRSEPTSAAGTAEAQKQGGSITSARNWIFPGFDPLKVGVFDTSAQIAAALIFDTLTYLDEKGEPQPKLALSWTHSDDYKTWTYKLRPGVRFHDGTPFNAQAVKRISTGRRTPPTSAAARFTFQGLTTCRRPTS